MKEHEDYPWIGACGIQEDTEKVVLSLGKKKAQWDLNNLYKYLMETVKRVDTRLSHIL